MNGVIVFKRPVTGLVDSTGAAITDGTVFQLQVIPKGAIQRVRVVEQRDGANPNKLVALALRMEVTAVVNSGTPDVILLAQLDNPSNTTIPPFFAHAEEVRRKVSSNTDEELTFKISFP